MPFSQIIPPSPTESKRLFYTSVSLLLSRKKKKKKRKESESEAAQSCPTLSDPMDCSLPGSSSVHGIFQARVLEWGAIAFSI